MPARFLNVLGRSNRAFSLVEVVLALTILSFAIIGILGLLSSGLVVFHRSIDLTTQAEIAQQVIGNEQLTSFTNLVSYTTNFDAFGNPTNSTAPTAIYTVNVVLTNLASSLATNISSAAGTNLVVQVCNKTTPGSTNIFSSILVNGN